jgi:hypothetical protein
MLKRLPAHAAPIPAHHWAVEGSTSTISKKHGHHQNEARPPSKVGKAESAIGVRRSATTIRMKQDHHGKEAWKNQSVASDEARVPSE